MILLAAAGCGVSAAAPDAGPPPRALEADLAVDASGFSPELAFTVPDGTRSVTIVATGDDGALLALGSLRTPDGTERVGLPPDAPPGDAMQTS